MNPDIASIPNDAVSLVKLGNKTLESLRRLYGDKQGHLFPSEPEFDLCPLAEALAPKWSDDQAAEVIDHFNAMRQQGRSIEIKLLSRWALQHINDSQAVHDCMMVEPPEGMEVLKVLSRKGSQKLVFLAKWWPTRQEIVLKQIRSTGEAAQKLISREMQSSPLSIVHPNIIETHFLTNAKGERFLVERRLTDVLYDDWPSKGIYEAANLLFDITKALKFLHAHELVHGDVKPDNIGKKLTSYVLLDFGICRGRSEFLNEKHATGSLRTRAPELLLTNSYQEPEKVDVWALGATVFKSVTNRFPLIKEREEIPRVSNGLPRQEFEKLLATRAEKEWEKWVETDEIHEPLAGVLKVMLEKDPPKRISSTALLDKIEKRLSAFLRSEANPSDMSGRFSPLDELMQIQRYMSSLNNDATLIPRHKRQMIRARLEELQTYHGFSVKEELSLKTLIQTLTS